MPIRRVLAAVAALLMVMLVRAEAQEAGSCSVTGSNPLTQQDQAEITITCTGIAESYGKPFADVLNRILKERLDPPAVMAKLSEVDRVPGEGVARLVSDEQAHTIIQSLNGKPVAVIVITAHPLIEDSVGFATSIANTLLRVGWQIGGQQIRRTAPKSLENVPGLAIVVRDKDAPPPPAAQLKAAFSAARIGASLIADAGVAPDTTMLWIGRRPTFTPTEPK